jgi:hypothetical protein
VARRTAKRCLGAYGRERAAEWEKNMLEFAEDNFNDAGIEVRKTCC